MYNKTKEYYFDKLNLKNIYQDLLYKYDYDFLKFPSNINIMSQYDKVDKEKNKPYSCLCKYKIKQNDLLSIDINYYRNHYDDLKNYNDKI